MYRIYNSLNTFIVNYTPRMTSRIAKKITMFARANKRYISSIKVPPKLCANCVHFEPTGNEYQFASENGICTRFPANSFVTNDVLYNTANHCRLDDRKCGHIGTHFEQDNDIASKIKNYENSILANIILTISFSSSFVIILCTIV